MAQAEVAAAAPPGKNEEELPEGEPRDDRSGREDLDAVVHQTVLVLDMAHKCTTRTSARPPLRSRAQDRLAQRNRQC